MRTLILRLIRESGADGVAPSELMALLIGQLSRSTLNRELAVLLAEGSIKRQGKARATRYVTTSPFTRAEIDAYFARPAERRPLVPFREELLGPLPNIDPERAARCLQIQALANRPGRSHRSLFLLYFTWASSLLEGSSYSELDTEALVRYGEPNPNKPIEDALLGLNHKLAGEYLWANRALSLQSLCRLHDLLTNDRGVVISGSSDHFLPQALRGRPRVDEDVNISQSAYVPPFRPGTSHAAGVLERIIDVASTLLPVQAAVYLLTRIPYAQSFANGNKRLSRVAANAPLLAAGVAPMTWLGASKDRYIRGLSAFYELGSMHVMEQVFIESYARSIVRSGDRPPGTEFGFKEDLVVAQLVDFINSGKRNRNDLIRPFLKTGMATANSRVSPAHGSQGR